MPHTTKYVTTLAVVDPDTRLLVPLEIHKDEVTGALLGLEHSFLDHASEGPWDPYNPNGEVLEIDESDDDHCQRLDHCETGLPGLHIEPPPDDVGPEPLFRVVYSIDLYAPDPHAAAQKTHGILLSPDSLPPVLEVIDHRGSVTTIDLADDSGE